MLWFMGLQIVGHDWATDLNWTELVTFSIVSYTCMSSFEKCLFKSFAHFKTGLFVFLLLSVCFPCRFQTLIPYQIMLWNYLLSFQRFPLYSEALWCDVIPFAWFFFSFVACAFSHIQKNHCPDQCQAGSFSLCFLLVVLQLSSYT